MTQKEMKTIIRQNPVLTYFLSTFIISWSGIALMAVFMGIPTSSTQFNNFGPVTLIPFLLGPTIVSVVLTRLLYGKEGLRQLSARLLRWKINVKWYMIAILTAPVLLTIILLILSQFSTDYAPNIVTERNKTQLIITGVLTGLLGGGLFEEIG